MSDRELSRVQYSLVFALLMLAAAFELKGHAEAYFWVQAALTVGALFVVLRRPVCQG